MNQEIKKLEKRIEKLEKAEERHQRNLQDLTQKQIASEVERMEVARD